MEHSPTWKFMKYMFRLIKVVGHDHRTLFAIFTIFCLMRSIVDILLPKISKNYADYKYYYSYEYEMFFVDHIVILQYITTLEKIHEGNLRASPLFCVALRGIYR